MVTVDLQVLHDDREIEINAASRRLSALLPTLAANRPIGNAPIDFGPQSCEHLAARITDAVKERYGAGRHITTTILEDGITWRPDTATEPGP